MASGTPSETRPLEHEIRIEAPPEAVFAHFTDPAKLVRWMGNEATLDPRPGGVFRLRMIREAIDLSIVGEFVEVLPPSRVVFTWGWDPDPLGVPPASTRVEVSLIPDAGGTLVRLVHRELPDGAAGIHRDGWSHYLDRLSVLSAGGDPGPDEWIPTGIPASPEKWNR